MPYFQSGYSKKFNATPIKANGVYLFFSDGHKCLDFSGGNFGENILGYSHPILEKSIINAINTGLLNQSNNFNNFEKEKLERKLCELAYFLDEKNEINGKVIFSNSISESSENAIKIVRNRYNKLCDRKYSEVICVKGGFCGNTITTISANGNYKEISEIEPKGSGFVIANKPTLQEINNLITEDTSAVMLETISFSNGIEECDYEFLRKLRELCNYHRIGLILNETICGVGRTGSFYAFQDYNIKPDIITIGYALACGLSLSACIVNNEFSKFIVKDRFETITINNLLYYTANNVIDKISQVNFLRNVDYLGDLLKTKLETLSKQYNNVIQYVSGIGLMLGIKIRDEIPVKRFANLLFSNGLITTILEDNKLGILPPLTITDRHIQEAYDIIINTIEELSIIERY